MDNAMESCGGLSKAEVVCRAVCARFGVDVGDLATRDMARRTCEARTLAMYILHRDHGFSISSLSRMFCRARRSVFLCCERAGRFIRLYKDYEADYNDICAAIGKGLS